MPDLLFEIGCEEIPAGPLAAAQGELARLARAALEAERLPAEKIKAQGTPRRLALVVRGVPARQPDVDEILTGPPESAGARAAQGFAKKHGLEAQAVVVEETDKGRRFVARRRVAGQDALSLLPELLGRLVRQIPWPKSMRWADRTETFVRPVHWMCALFGGEVVPVEFAGVRSGRSSFGHRFLAPSAFEVDSIESWHKALRARFVLVDPDERRQMVAAELARIEKETGLKARPDEALLAEVTNLVEYPVGVCGRFDERFLEVPEPVIVSAMRSHQRYFALETPAGKLANRFVAIAGTIVKEPERVAHGNERVLAARLADARFFFDEDRKVSLEERAQKLDGIVWIQKLGTMREKVDRLKNVAVFVAQCVGVDQVKIMRAAELAKADLLTHVVGEFPELQGIIGTAYARAAGEEPPVADAIAEHYQPRGATDRPAKGAMGAALAVADRADTLVGCFAAGLVPTGSQDPYGLRRAALGMLQTILAHGWQGLSLLTVCGSAAQQYTKVNAQGVLDQVLDFLKVRLRGLFVEDFHGDLVDAVLEVDFGDPVDAQARLRALAALRPRPDFEPLGIAIKRVGNILKGMTPPAAPEAALLKEPAERALLEAAETIARKVAPLFDQRDYGAALRVLTEFKAPVDAFFDKVFVMDKDARVRDNRLALLASINRLFLRVADFRQLNLG